MADLSAHDRNHPNRQIHEKRLLNCFRLGSRCNTHECGCGYGRTPAVRYPGIATIAAATAVTITKLPIAAGILAEKTTGKPVTASRA